MTDHTNPDEYIAQLNAATDGRIEIIHNALRTICKTIGAALEEKREPTAKDASEALLSVLTLADATLTAVTEMAAAQMEIAHSVGKITEIMERDFKMDVAMQAERKADEMVAERSKRSFIGQSRK